jgi:replicative DNA helicase
LGTLDACGGIQYIMTLVSSVASGANLDYNVKVVKDAHMKRILISEDTGSIDECYKNKLTAEEIIKRKNVKLLELESGIGQVTTQTLATDHDQYVAELMAKGERKKTMKRGEVLGVTTGNDYLDVVTEGYQEGQLIIAAARPGMGKSIFATHGAIEIARTGQNVGLINLEMTNSNSRGRVIANLLDINSKKIRNATLEDHEYEAISKLKYSPVFKNIYIDDRPGRDWMSIQRQIMVWVLVKKVKVIFIDYLQLIRTEGSDTNKEIGKITRAAKELAKQLGITIVMFSQLSREVEKRADKIPQLSDLRDSGNIEQDADTVIFLMRPAYYWFSEFIRSQFVGIGSKEFDKLLIIIVAKQREGSSGQWLPSFINVAKSRLYDATNRDVVSRVSGLENYDPLDFIERLSECFQGNFKSIATKDSLEMMGLQEISHEEDNNLPF